MITLFSTLIGLISAAFPDMLKMWRDHQDRQHELVLLRMQMEQQAAGHANRLEEVGIQADIAESQAIYRTFKSGIDWVDALNGTVRPVIAYAFFLLYAGVKLWQFSLLSADPLPWQYNMLWGEEDRAIFAGIIAFYFGQRAMSKVRGGR